VGIEIKNEKFILRSVDELSQEDLVDWCNESVGHIAKLKDPPQQQEQAVKIAVE